jgi:hypothetical protein
MGTSHRLPKPVSSNYCTVVTNNRNNTGIVASGGCCLDTDLRKRYLGSELVTCGRIPLKAPTLPLLAVVTQDVSLCIWISFYLSPCA